MNQIYRPRFTTDRIGHTRQSMRLCDDQIARNGKSAYIFGSHVINFNRFCDIFHIHRSKIILLPFMQSLAASFFFFSLCFGHEEANLIWSSMENTCSDNANHRHTITDDKLISLNWYVYRQPSSVQEKTLWKCGKYRNGRQVMIEIQI